MRYSEQAQSAKKAAKVVGSVKSKDQIVCATNYYEAFRKSIKCKILQSMVEDAYVKALSDIAKETIPAYDRYKVESEIAKIRAR